MDAVTEWHIYTTYEKKKTEFSWSSRPLSLQNKILTADCKINLELPARWNLTEIPWVIRELRDHMG